MRLRSAIDDLTTTTLTAVSGLWASLEYLAGLSKEEGYSHWGLTRVHGEKAAQEALAAAHKSTLSKVLRSPIHDLEEEVEKASESQGLSSEAYLRKLHEGCSELLPQKPPAAAERPASSRPRARS